MEEYDTPDPQFMKGFNEGYFIAKHLPALAEQLEKIEGGTPRSTGFLAGQRQILLEQQQERYPAWLRGDHSERTQSLPDLDITPDIDLGPER